MTSVLGVTLVKVHAVFFFCAYVEYAMKIG